MKYAFASFCEYFRFSFQNLKIDFIGEVLNAEKMEQKGDKVRYDNNNET